MAQRQFQATDKGNSGRRSGLAELTTSCWDQPQLDALTQVDQEVGSWVSPGSGTCFLPPLSSLPSPCGLLHFHQEKTESEK